MGRPERHDVDYFPFFAKRGRTLNILQSKYGLEGIGFFTNLMRFLALTPDHHYCISNETDRMNFFAEIGIQDEDKGIEMLELMVKTEKLDKELWENHKVIVCEAFLLSLNEAYKQRKNKIITVSEIREKFISINGNPVIPGKDGVSIYGNPAVYGLSSEIQGHNPQSKVKKSKAKKSKLNSEASPLVVSETVSRQKTKKPPLRGRDPENDMERVEKTYLQNWDALYSQKQVETPDPIVNWNQTRALLKKYFERLKPERIIQAINNGLKDDFVMNGGYSLAVILSASVLNRLVNANHDSPPGQSAPPGEDMTAGFQKARKLWNDLKINPQCRDLIIPQSEYACLRTFQNYSPDEIENAIRNFHWHTTQADEDWARPPLYGSIYGFLKTGVARYYDDEACEQQFKEVR